MILRIAFVSLLTASISLAGPRADITAKNAARLMKPTADPIKEWYAYADHGPAFVQTFTDWFEGNQRSGAAIKGLLLTSGEDFRKVALFDTETLKLVTATHMGIRLDNTPWAGYHGTENKVLNLEYPLFNSASGPGWADASGSFKDNREFKGHGALPHTQFLGYYTHGSRTVIEYTVHGTRVLDSVSYVDSSIERTLQVGPRSKPLSLHMASESTGWITQGGHAGGKADRASRHTVIESIYGEASFSTLENGHNLIATLPASEQETTVIFSYSRQRKPQTSQPKRSFVTEPKLDEFLKGGPAQSPETFTVKPVAPDSSKPWTVEIIPLPPILEKSPYRSKVRTADFDFFSDGDRAAISTWGGDIWIVSGLKDFKELTWKRFATGTFEPLGLKISNDIIHIASRDGVYQLIDLNDDNECDHYKVFNYDVLITANFHEFHFGLEQDNEGNFYFSKASPVRGGGRGFDKILPHNGTLIKVSADGSTSEVMATGLRAPGGMSVGPNGELTTGENEGTWQPACKINYITKDDGKVFLGTVDSAHQLAGQPFHEPLCYLPMDWDNSGGSQVWVPENNALGFPAGTLLHLSYGQSSIYRTFIQEFGDTRQAGVAKLPVQLGSSAQRGAFHQDGSFYVCGFRSWQSNAATLSAIQRIRRTEASNPMPVSLTATSKGVTLGFDQELDEELAIDPTSYTVERWDYVRSSMYGSGHFSADNINEKARRNATKEESRKHRVHDKVIVTSATLSDDKKSISLTLGGHKPSHQLHIAYDLETTSGDELIGETVQTIYALP